VEGRLMLVLAVETSTPQTSLALGSEQGVLAAQQVSWARGHSEAVVPGIRHLLELTEVRPTQLSGIAVGLGPGLFTGLRVGVSTARALSQVLRIPLVGIGSLDVLAFSVRYAKGRIAAVTDAKRGEVFYAFYRPVPGGVTRETGYLAGTPERLAADLEASGEEILLVGMGSLLYRRQLHEAASGVEFASVSRAFPTADSLLELALPRFQREETSRPGDVMPYYVRKSDAEIDWPRAGRVA
jgi:tRNA threonylcarbamoyladenosine biosynthesis protein TsaB